jgi:hypothetical protein
MLNHSARVAPLPATGTIHVRYYTKFAHGWFFTDQTYTMNVVLPAITTPVPGSTLTSGTVDFQWTANGQPVAEWWLQVGSTLGGNNIFDSGSLGTSTSRTVSTLPVNGSQVFVRLWYRVGVTWLSSDFQYTAHTGPQVRFLNGLVLAPAGTPFTATLIASEGFRWGSFSGVPSPYQFVTNTLSNFTVLTPVVTLFFPGTFNLQSGRKYMIVLTISGGLVLGLVDEGPAAALAPQELGTPEQFLRGQMPEGEPAIRFAPIPDKRRQPSVR